MNTSSYGRRVLVLLVVLLGGLAAGLADNGWEGHILSLNADNDTISGTDRHYTHGAHILYLTADDRTPRWARWLSDHIPAPGMEKQTDKLGLGIAQEIYTPDDLENLAVVLDDRPFAGWLYGTVALRRRGQTVRAWPVMEDLRLDLGVIGPEALGEDAQRVFHGNEPLGWHNQLKTEPGMALRYERRYLFSWKNADRPWGLDLIPNAGASVGNVATFLNLGATVRVGCNIPNEFEVPLKETPYQCGVYLFGGAEGRAVARNIFLDGNTFRSSHHVDKIPLVADLKVGCTAVIRNVEFTVAQIFRTREFQLQRASDSFTSATITMKY